MAKLKILLEKKVDVYRLVIANFKAVPDTYPKYLAYDTLDDEEAYNMCNHGYNPKTYPRNGVH